MRAKTRRQSTSTRSPRRARRESSRTIASSNAPAPRKLSICESASACEASVEGGASPECVTALSIGGALGAWASVGWAEAGRTARNPDRTNAQRNVGTNGRRERTGGWKFVKGERLPYVERQGRLSSATARPTTQGRGSGFRRLDEGIRLGSRPRKGAGLLSVSPCFSLFQRPVNVCRSESGSPCSASAVVSAPAWKRAGTVCEYDATHLRDTGGWGSEGVTGKKRVGSDGRGRPSGDFWRFVR